MISKRLRIVSLLMACMVFVSTSMHSMAIHYCNGHFAGIKLFKSEKAISEISSCCVALDTQCVQTPSKGCCDDEYITMDWDTDISSAVTLDFELNQSWALTKATDFANSVPVSTRSTLPQHYIPPLLALDKHISFQQFLL